ncbi:calcium/sodium antiporter [Methanococcus aeolicus]|uniref:calcium/sodium antiporter n=1 Tax=Methanococcus aeolicus TaxID=42879 RepID=UPI0021C76490|nr:calcium/sodium antiporter [Methanococcus aeolicus]UXM84308.1 calcium/sodium antiporter [Methanococcus aeolicus]
MVEILFSVFILLLGLALLNYGSDWFVVGSSKVAKHLNVSDFVIGATVVAFGTSLPEIITSVYASYIGSTGIAVGNSLGSNIANVGLILGLSALIAPIYIKKENILKNGYIYLLFTIIAFILGYDGFNSIDGILLFIMLISYITYTIKKGGCCEEMGENNGSIVKSVLFTILGLLAVIVGSSLFVSGAKDIALFLGISDKIIGFTLVAFGTSLPELVVSITAVKRKLGDMVIGNIIGSNIANIGGALALASIINPLPKVPFEMTVYLLLTSLMVLFMSKHIMEFIKKNKDKIHNKKDNNDNETIYSKINRIDGTILILIYLGFILFISNIL